MGLVILYGKYGNNDRQRHLIVIWRVQSMGLYDNEGVCGDKMIGCEGIESFGRVLPRKL